MTHSDPDVLAMMAMGESGLPDDDVRHIRSCQQCRSELRSLERVADLARSGHPDESFARPSPAVWNRIAATVGIDPASAAPDGHEAARPDVPLPSPAASVLPEAHAHFSDADAPRSDADAPRSDATSHGTGRRRRRRPTHRRARRIIEGIVLLAPIVAGVIAIIVIPRDPAVVIDEVELDPLSAGSGFTGDAVVQGDGDGVRELAIALDGTDASASGGSYREVWLLSSDSSRLVSLGVLEGSRGSFVLPDSIDLADYPVVDVSVEPLDGDPAHSGVSIVRGALGT